MITWLKQDKPLFVWMPPTVWACVIFVFSLLPYRTYVQFTVGHFDKMAHFFEYTILAALLLRSLRLTKHLSFNRTFLFALILCGGYGILMELMQRFVPGRDSSVSDIIINFMGTIFGIFVGRIMLWQK
jgi:VanZ family protein